MVLPIVTLMLLSLAGGILLMRNAMIPVVTSIALPTTGMVSGGVLTETVLSWPGMGLCLVQRTLSYDFPAIQAAFCILALITILSNRGAGVRYAWLDPRIRL
jgi:peptide/nickel transport system permease protein